MASNRNIAIWCEGALRHFLLERELAERWNKSRRTLQRMRNDGSGPAFHRIGRSILYKIEDIEAFELAARVGGANQ